MTESEIKETLKKKAEDHASTTSPRFPIEISEWKCPYCMEIYSSKEECEHCIQRHESLKVRCARIIVSFQNNSWKILDVQHDWWLFLDPDKAPSFYQSDYDSNMDVWYAYCLDDPGTIQCSLERLKTEMESWLFSRFNGIEKLQI